MLVTTLLMTYALPSIHVLYISTIISMNLSKGILTLQVYDRGPSENTKVSYNSNCVRHHFDIILTLQIVEILIFSDGILTVETNCRMGILMDKPFLHQNSLEKTLGSKESSHTQKRFCNITFV